LYYEFRTRGGRSLEGLDEGEDIPVDGVRTPSFNELQPDAFGPNGESLYNSGDPKREIIGYDPKGKAIYRKE
jgi:hypothetical protein